MATIHVHSGKNDFSNKDIKQSKVQSMPFSIQADCDAEVKNYFDQFVKTDDDGGLTGSFRGYPLTGKVEDMPEGYKGLVLQERLRPTTEKDERNFYVWHNFDKIVYWNWDKKPSRNDAFKQALEWIEIAECLHAPILEE